MAMRVTFGRLIRIQVIHGTFHHSQTHTQRSRELKNHTAFDIKHVPWYIALKTLVASFTPCRLIIQNPSTRVACRASHLIEYDAKREHDREENHVTDRDENVYRTMSRLSYVVCKRRQCACETCPSKMY
jgi:hypothetical protein